MIWTILCISRFYYQALICNNNYANSVSQETNTNSEYLYITMVGKPDIYSPEDSCTRYIQNLQENVSLIRLTSYFNYPWVNNRLLATDNSIDCLPAVKLRRGKIHVRSDYKSSSFKQNRKILILYTDINFFKKSIV